jgi:hypothetical protein
MCGIFIQWYFYYIMRKFWEFWNEYTDCKIPNFFYKKPNVFVFYKLKK